MCSACSDRQYGRVSALREATADTTLPGHGGFQDRRTRPLCEPSCVRLDLPVREPSCDGLEATRTHRRAGIAVRPGAPAARAGSAHPPAATAGRQSPHPVPVDDVADRDDADHLPTCRLSSSPGTSSAARRQGPGDGAFRRSDRSAAPTSGGTATSRAADEARRSSRSARRRQGRAG